MTFSFSWSRARLARKNSIRDHISTLLNWKARVVPNGQALIPADLDTSSFPSSGVRGLTSYPADFTQKIQSFFPQCKISLCGSANKPVAPGLISFDKYEKKS